MVWAGKIVVRCSSTATAASSVPVAPALDEAGVFLAAARWPPDAPCRGRSFGSITVSAADTSSGRLYVAAGPARPGGTSLRLPGSAGASSFSGAALSGVTASGGVVSGAAMSSGVVSGGVVSSGVASGDRVFSSAGTAGWTAVASTAGG